MAISNAEKLRRVHQRMLERFDRIWGAQRDERLQCLQDRRFCFVAGAQWEGALSEQFSNRPKLEMNKVRKAVNRVISEYRQNRIEARFMPRKEGPAHDSAADAATSAYRAACGSVIAQVAKDNAFEEAVSGGIGAWRLRPMYEDERDPENEHQHVCLEPIYDADVRVFMDDNSLRPDKSDAKWGFVITPYSVEAYKEAFDDDDPASWKIDTTMRFFDWVTLDVVYVAEYYEIQKAKTTLRLYRHLDGSEQRVMDRDLENDPDLERWLSAVGAKKTGEREIELPEVRKYIANGSRIIEDCGRIPGEYIPIIMTYGHRAVVDGVERCSGVVRVAKDPQRLKNMLTSKLADISATGSTEKPIFFPKQVAGHTALWAEDNIKNNPYLLINEMTDPVTGQIVPTGPIAYTKPPPVPQALGALLELAEFDIKDLLGSTENAEKVASNVSEQTVSLVQQQIDLQSYVYVSSFQRAEQYAGVVWLSMAKELFVESGRKLKGATQDGKPEVIELQKRTIDPASGAAYISADFPSADLGLDVSYGPSSAGKRAATVRELTQMLAIVKDQEITSVLEALTLMNIDGEGMSDTRTYFRKKLLAIGAVEPTDEERAEMEAQAQKPEDANSQYLRAAAENEVAKAVKARADTLLALAKADQARMEAAATGANVDRQDVDQLMKLSNELGASQPGAPQAPMQPASPQ